MKKSERSSIRIEPNHLSRKILTIEDEEDLRHFVELRLSRAGYKVFEASDGIEGLEQLYKVKPHLVVLDIKMPRMDGWNTFAVFERFLMSPSSSLQPWEVAVRE